MKSARMRKKKKSKNPRFKFLFSQAYKVLFEFIEVFEFFHAKKKIKMADFHIRSIWIQLQSCLMPMKKFERAALVPDFVQKCR